MNPPPVLPTIPPPLPPPLPPKKRYNAWRRVPLSLVGLLIALAPAPMLLFNAREVGELWKHNAVGLIASIIIMTLAGSYLCVRALVTKRWTAILCWLLLAFGFLLIDGAIGFFYGCLYALRNV